MYTDFIGKFVSLFKGALVLIISPVFLMTRFPHTTSHVTMYGLQISAAIVGLFVCIGKGLNPFQLSYAFVVALLHVCNRKVIFC